jgi:hypothetical protein
LKGKQPGRDDRRDHDKCRDLFASAPSNCIFRRDFPSPLDSLRRQLKGPRQDERDGKTEEDDRDKHLHHPRRGLEGREQNRGRLNEKPGHHGVSDRDFVNVTPLQLGEEIARIHLSRAFANQGAAISEPPNQNNGGL